MIRLASSLANRTAPAHVILQKLIANPRADGVAKALTILGRIVKTTFLLRYMRDTELRQKIRTQLNRGEHRHALARKLFFGNQGIFTTGDYEEMMNKSHCFRMQCSFGTQYNSAESQPSCLQPSQESHRSPMPTLFRVAPTTLLGSPILSRIPYRSFLHDRPRSPDSAWIFRVVSQ